MTLTGGVENSLLRLSSYAGFLTLLYGGALVPCRGFDLCWVLPMSMSSSSVGNSKFVGMWICFLSRDTPPDGRCASTTKPFPFDPHEGFGPHFVRVVAMLIHVEAAIVTVVSAASTGVAQLGVAFEARVTWYI